MHSAVKNKPGKTPLLLAAVAHLTERCRHAQQSLPMWNTGKSNVCKRIHRKRCKLFVQRCWIAFARSTTGKRCSWPGLERGMDVERNVRAVDTLLIRWSFPLSHRRTHHHRTPNAAYTRTCDTGTFRRELILAHRYVRDVRGQGYYCRLSGYKTNLHRSNYRIATHQVYLIGKCCAFDDASP